VPIDVCDDGAVERLSAGGRRGLGVEGPELRRRRDRRKPQAFRAGPLPDDRVCNRSDDGAARMLERPMLLLFRAPHVDGAWRPRQVVQSRRACNRHQIGRRGTDCRGTGRNRQGNAGRRQGQNGKAKDNQPCAARKPPHGASRRWDFVSVMHHRLVRSQRHIQPVRIVRLREKRILPADHDMVGNMSRKRKVARKSGRRLRTHTNRLSYCLEPKGPEQAG